MDNITKAELYIKGRGDMVTTFDLLHSGWAGVARENGQIVDRRDYPNAVPIPASPSSGVPAPRSLSELSDGYHTFNELYEHRIQLFISLCAVQHYIGVITESKVGKLYNPVWKSKQHSDGSSYEGWFLLGIAKNKGEQITYHLPISKWDECSFAEELEKAPEFDGHTSADVLKRLRTFY